MMSVIVIFAFSVLLPTSIVAGMNIPHVTNSSSHPNFHPLKLSHSQKLNSSHSREFSRTGIVKREIGDESEDALHPYYTALISKRSAQALKDFITGRFRGVPFNRMQSDSEFPLKEKDDASTDISYPKLNGVDRYVSVPFARRGSGQSPSNKKYLRCYFNAVSCFKKRK